MVVNEFGVLDVDLVDVGLVEAQEVQTRPGLLSYTLSLVCLLDAVNIDLLHEGWL